MPIQHTTWQRAFILIFAGRAEAVSYYEKSVKTPSSRYLIPAVIRLFEYNKVPSLNVHYSRWAVFERDEFRCQYCSIYLEKTNRTIDHVIPTSLGGRSTFENTVAACLPCNNRKGGMTPKEAKMPLKRKPFIPKTSRYTIFLGCKVPDEWIPYLPVKAVRSIDVQNDN
jgi:5-methylcytosine-specific restriction endonuclease McrA